MTVRIACLLLTWSVFSVNGQDVNITTVPDDATLLLGYNLTISCITSANAEVRLRINGEPTTENVRVVDTNPNSDARDRTFNYINVTQADNGLRFSCYVNAFFLGSEEVTLNVLFAPEYEFAESMYSATESEQFVVIADVSANPSVEEDDVEWSRNDEIIAEDNNVQFNATALYILNVSRNDAGTYYISGNNSVGVGKASFELQVYFGPDFVSTGGRIDVFAGRPLVIDCRVSDSNPEVQFVRISGTNLAETTLLEGSRMYTVEDQVTTEFTSRTYTCYAGNGQTTSQIMYTVYVNEITSSTTISASSSSGTLSLTSTGSSPTVVVDTGSDGLSSGAVGGIIAGVIIGVILIVAVVVIVAVVLIYFFKKGAAKA